MTSTDVAALITAIGVSIGAIITAVAALRNANANAARMEQITKDNEHLRAENEKKTEHNEFQDRVILDQQRKIEKWQQWGERIGRKLNEMELQIGYQQKQSKGDTHPLKKPTDKDWLTGPLGPLDVKDIDDADQS